MALNDDKTRTTAVPDALASRTSSAGSVRPRRSLSGSQIAPAIRRRSSSLSDYSREARNLLNPMPAMQTDETERSRATSGWDWLPLAFALLPALGGLLVQGGNAFVTDLMLLALGALFLHWSVTQPWTWYYSAQQVREDHQRSAIADDSDEEPANPVKLADVPEEEGAEEKTADAASPEADSEQQAQRLRQQERWRFRQTQETALRELHRHEVLALLLCFAAPAMGACLLHGLRGQLTRPSEGLISDYNLAIFLLGAEVRPLRHLISLVQARTLHLQRVVHADPYRDEEERYRERRAGEEKTQNETIEDLTRRLAALEDHNSVVTDEEPDAIPKSVVAGRREREQLVREVRAQMQPELDMMARAMRRAHKQQTLLEGQLVEQRQALDRRLDETESLARATARLQQRQRQRQRQNRLWQAVCILGQLAGAAWEAVLWAYHTALDMALYVPRRAAALLRLTEAKTVDKTEAGSRKKNGMTMSGSTVPPQPDTVGLASRKRIHLLSTSEKN